MGTKVVAECEEVFCRWGIPLSLRSDNLQQFISAKFQLRRTIELSCAISFWRTGPRFILWMVFIQLS